MQQNSLLDMQPGGGSFLLSDPSTTNRDRASLHIYEEDDKSGDDYGYKASMVNFPTTPTLQQVGSDAPESKVTLDNSSNEEYQPQKMQIKHASQSAIIQASKLRATQMQAYDNIASTITGAIEPPHIIDQRQRGIGVYQPNSSHVSSMHSTAQNGGGNAINFLPQANNANGFSQQPQGLIRSQSAAYGNPQTVLQSRNKIVGQIGRVKEVGMSSELQMQSMSSFVPSAHLLSTSVDGGHDMRRVTQQRNSLSAASGDFNQQQYQQRDHSGGQDGGAGLNDTMASRRNNLNLLDQNFSQLMEQNSRLEREIRDMNAQFTQKQNERLAMAQSQLDAHHNAQLNATPSRSENTNTQPSAMKVSDLQQRPEEFVLQQMQSSFDDRCQRTKQIVSTLASRLHEVKRDTSTELDKLQTRQSCSKQSRGISTENSNSRSPRPNKVVAVSQPTMDTAKHSHKNSQGFFTPHEQHSHVSLRKLNQQEHTDRSTQRQREMVRFNQGNGDNMMLVDDVMYDVSAVQTHQTNTQNVSVNSTANNFNFRQLKPQESCHTSLNELQTSGKSPTSDCKRTMNFGGNPAEQNFVANDGVDTQEQLCFESSPIRKSQQESCNALFAQRQQEQMQQTKTTNCHPSQNRCQLNTQSLILQGLQGNNININSADEPQKTTFNESLMQMIPSANADDSQQRQTVDSQGQQTISQQQSFKSTQQKQLDQIRLQSEQLKMSIKNPDTMVSTNEQNLAAILDQNNQTLGPDRSPLNVNGAAQLSNILQQINNNNNANSHNQGNGRNTDLPLQHIAQATEHTTLSPSNLLNQKQTAFFLSQDNKNTAGINHVEQVQQSQAEAHNITQPTPRAVGLNQQIDTMMCDKQSHHNQVSQLTKKEQVLNVLRQNLAEQEINQDNLSRQLDNNTLQERTHTSDGMTNATFDRMHMDIMKLQDKIKFLESQMVTSPSARNTIQANEEQKSIRDGAQESIKVTLESNMSAPYKHDSKHMKESSKISILKMTVPKTVTVQPFAENSGYHQSEMVASQRCYQQDDKSLAHTSSHKHMNSHPVADQCMAENHVTNDARRFKSRSVVEPSLFKISEKQIKHSARHLHNELTYRERDEKSSTPLQRDIGDLMSQSQPELVKLRKGRRDSSIKTISRIGSRRSSKTKSPKSRSQKSKSRKQGSSRADQKSLLKHSKDRKSSSSQMIPQQALSRRSRDKHGSTMAAEPFADLSQNPVLGVSFRELNEDLDETAQAKQREIILKEQTQMTDAYIITNSEYTGTSPLTSNRDQANKGQLIMSQIMSPKVIASNDLIHSGQPSSPGHQYNDQQPSLVEEFSQDEAQALSSSAQTLSQSRKQQKQTFPLRVRKNQTFAKGPDCVSVPSSITQAAEKFMVDSQDLSDDQINTLRVQDQRSCISAGHPDHFSSSDQPPNTIQEDILRDYEIQISANKHPSGEANPGKNQQNSRNHMQHINTSEMEQVQNAVSSYLFDPLQIDQHAQEEKAQNGNGTNFSNQTSRFEQQPISKKQTQQSIERETDENPCNAYRDTSDRPKARSTLKRVNGIESDRSEGPDVKVNFSNEVDDYSGDESTDDNMRCLEQRPFSPPEKKKLSKRSSNHADSKVCSSRDLPLQRQSHSRDGSAAKVRATEKSRIAFLEQRNKHLELELKRHQVHLAKSDELHQKYRCLKLDYKQLLQSFERSEEIRREQKELINEQRQQLKNLKVQVKQQEGTIGELVRDTEQLKAVNMNNLSSMFDQSRVQTENQTRALRNASGNNTHSYQMPPNQAYNSGSERSRDTSRSQQSVSQMSRSQLQMTGQSHSFNMAQSAQNYGMMANGQIASDMPLQYTKPTILQSYAALNGHGMLDLPPNMGTDLLPDGYSCMEEGNSQQQIGSDQGGRLRDRRTVKRGKRQHRSRSETSEKSSRKRKKSHKKKHHKRRHNDHSRPKKAKRDAIEEYSRSLSEHRSRSNKSQRKRKQQSGAAILTNNYLVEDPNSFLQSAQSSARPPRDSRKCSATKRRSRSRKSKKEGKEADYIYNIQTNPSDIIKGVHRFQSTAKSSFDQQTSRRSSSARKSGKQKYQTTTTHFRP